MKCWWTKFSTFHLKFVTRAPGGVRYNFFINWQRGPSACKLSLVLRGNLCIHWTNLGQQYTIWKLLHWWVFSTLNLTKLFFNIFENIEICSKMGFSKLFFSLIFFKFTRFFRNVKKYFFSRKLKKWNFYLKNVKWNVLYPKEEA